MTTMNKFYYLIFLLAFFSCKKKEKEKTKEIIVPHVDNVAPCTLDYREYDYDSVFYSPSQNFPNAVFRIKFGNVNGTYFEFAFEKIPTTGTYYTVQELNPSLDVDQVAFKEHEGAYGLISMPTEPQSVYVEMNADRFIISACQLNTRFANPETWQVFSGDVQISMKFKKEF